jgi:hypothetical protein
MDFFGNGNHRIGPDSRNNFPEPAIRCTLIGMSADRGN